MITAATAFLILFGSPFVVSAFRVSGGQSSLSERAGYEASRNAIATRERLPAPRSESDEVAYWQKLAGKRLRLLGGMELQRNHARAQYRALRRTLLHRSSVTEAINLACVVYGHCATLWSKARCESHLNPYARNGSSGSSGLFQFLPSTWRSTPYGRFNIFSANANALAAGWMHAHGRSGEWVCR